MSDEQLLAGYIKTWREVCADFLTLARSLDAADWDRPTDLEGWSVRDNVAHTAHLESVLAGAPEETAPVETAAHVKSLSGHYTEQGVRARADRTVDDLVAEFEAAVAKRSAELDAEPPTDASAPSPRTPGGIGWDTGTLLRNRPLDVWMHEQDIRRAIGRPGGFDGRGARHTVALFSAALPMILGKRVAPPAGTTVTFSVPEHDLSRTVAIDESGRATQATSDSPTTTLTFSPEAFILLCGGRRTPDSVEVTITGDEALGRRILDEMAVTP